MLMLEFSWGIQATANLSGLETTILLVGELSRTSDIFSVGNQCCFMVVLSTRDYLLHLQLLFTCGWDTTWIAMSWKHEWKQEMVWAPPFLMQVMLQLKTKLQHHFGRITVGSCLYEKLGVLGLRKTTAQVVLWQMWWLELVSGFSGLQGHSLMGLMHADIFPSCITVHTTNFTCSTGNQVWVTGWLWWFLERSSLEHLGFNLKIM